MQKRQGASARIVLIGVFGAVVAIVLLSLAVRTVGEYCSASPSGCTIWTFFAAYWETIGDFLEKNEGAIEACGTIFVAIFTFTLWAATQKLGDLALEQGEAMDRSITEATRATQATNSIATVTRENAELMQSILHRQMRAYVSVDAGQAIYQDERLRFAGVPVITNTGYTPARNVSHHVMAAILDTDLREDFEFEKFGLRNVSDATLSPRQSFTINSPVRERFPDGEVEALMSGEARRLYVWGVVAYEDIFGGKWETNFCFNYTFFRNGKNDVRVASYIYRQHNNAT
ncbi:hypothetical protein IHE49_00515 [Rhodanobacter sp. 7MK24]|uniref:hypothetical protein n=1 Tax=Rhodanobacter sp. 7MK24 TaxID=2775922 RepID=UPI0017862D82|nr:hypothetical protein [Rhodanobacter sp. 7MK24]MBD8878956.1 hypothetical protein [Rhodanobacter sp. 7MK24]